MRSGFEQSASNPVLKTVWIKPAVSRLRAGAAENNTGAIDDGDNGSAQNNS